MSNRFHNKWHRHNHHTYPTPGLPDSSHDPIASPDHPFNGDFIISGGLSAIAPLSSHTGYFYNSNHDEGVLQNIPVFPSMSSMAVYSDGNEFVNGALSAKSIWTTHLYSTTAVVEVQDIFITEVSGFTVRGDLSSTDLVIPPTVTPGVNLVLLSGVGISGTNWVSFDGDLRARDASFRNILAADITANSLAVSSLTTTNLSVSGCLKTDCISAFTPGQSAINIWNNLNLHGYNISGIGNSSLVFESSARITSNASQQIVLDSQGFSENLTCVLYPPYSHTEGGWTSALGSASHAEGYYTRAENDEAHAEGNQTVALGRHSHSEGYMTSALNDDAHVEGIFTQASGMGSHAEGISNIAAASGAHVEGGYSIASGSYAHAEGSATLASALASHAEGLATSAIEIYSHAEGWETVASGQPSHAEGFGTLADGNDSHAEGQSVSAIGVASHAEGYFTQAIGDRSHAAGTRAIAVDDDSWIWSGGIAVLGVSSQGTGSFTVCASGGVYLGDPVYVSNLTAINIDATNIEICGCLLTDCISSYTPATTAIQIHNNLDMNGYSISGIGNSSLVFEDDSKIATEHNAITIHPAGTGDNYWGDSVWRSALNLHVATDADYLVTFKSDWYSPTDLFGIWYRTPPIIPSLPPTGLAFSHGTSGSSSFTDYIVLDPGHQMVFLPLTNAVGSLSCLAGASAIEVYSDINMNGYSISGIGLSSLQFQNGAKLVVQHDAITLRPAGTGDTYWGDTIWRSALHTQIVNEADWNITFKSDTFDPNALYGFWVSNLTAPSGLYLSRSVSGTSGVHNDFLICTFDDVLVLPATATRIDGMLQGNPTLQIDSDIDMNGHGISNASISAASVSVSSGTFTNLTATSSLTLSTVTITDMQAQTLINPLTASSWALTMNVNGSAFAIPLWQYM